MQAGFTLDHFALFGLKPGYTLDSAELGERYRALQRELHPDRYAAAPEVERRLALQYAAHVNEAYRTLRDPLLRAQYLLALRGADPQLLRSGPVAPAFLAQQMEWRERLSEARLAGDRQALRGLGETVQEQVGAIHAALAGAFQTSEGIDECAELVRRLQFLNRLRDEIEDSMAH